MFASEYADFGRPQPALRSVTDPVRSAHWEIFFTVLRAQPLSGYAAIIAYFASKRSSRNVWIHILTLMTLYPW